MEYIQHLQEKMIADLNRQVDNIFIKALERKGFHFARRDYLIEFIKQRCTCVDNIELKEKVYFVDEIPFLFHDYKTDFSINHNENHSVTMNATIGSFAFID